MFLKCIIDRSSHSFLFIELDACCSFACNVKEVLERQREGQRGPGRMHIGMMDDLLGMEQYGVLKRRTED